MIQVKTAFQNDFSDTMLVSFFDKIHDLGLTWLDNTDRWLDTEFFKKHSAMKLCNSYVESETENEKLSQAQILEFASAAYHLYGNRWNELYETTIYEYNPIENYNMTETEATSSTANGTASAYAFNSTQATPTDTNSGTGSNSRTMTRAGNIGVMTTESLILEQRNVVMFNIYCQMFKDIDSMIALRVY